MRLEKSNNDKNISKIKQSSNEAGPPGISKEEQEKIIKVALYLRTAKANKSSVLSRSDSRKIKKIQGLLLRGRLENSKPSKPTLSFSSLAYRRPQSL